LAFIRRICHDARPLNVNCDRCVDVVTHKQYIEGATTIELLKKYLIGMGTNTHDKLLMWTKSDAINSLHEFLLIPHSQIILLDLQ